MVEAPHGQARLLVPVSDHPTSERALAVAGPLARMLDAHVELVEVTPADHTGATAEAHLLGVAAAHRAAHGGPPPIVTVARSENPADAIVATAGDDAIVVMATSSAVHAGDRFVGSIAETALRALGRPIVLVGPSCELDHAWKVGEVLVPLDGSRRAEAALPIAAEWAKRLDAALWLVGVIQPSAPGDDPEGGVDRSAHAARIAYLQEVGHRLRGTQLDVCWDAIDADDVVDAMLRRADDAGLIVMTTHARIGLQRIAEGSVASKLTAGARQPVVVLYSK